MLFYFKIDHFAYFPAYLASDYFLRYSATNSNGFAGLVLANYVNACNIVGTTVQSKYWRTFIVERSLFY